MVLMRQKASNQKQLFWILQPGVIEFVAAWSDLLMGFCKGVMGFDVVL